MPGLAHTPATAPAWPDAEGPHRTPRAIRLVLIDSETAFTRVLAHRAAALRWQCRVADPGITVEALADGGADAVVLDPATVGDAFWAFLGDLVAGVPASAVLVASQRSSVTDRVRGLRLGADDWITKPLHPDEVMARIEVAVRRHGGAAGVAPPEPIAAGELEIRPDRFQAYVDGESTGLTRREYELLELLANADGRVLEREDIYERVWGYSMVRGDRSVDVFVGKIRGKLARRSPEWRYVHTHVGVGYRFGAEPAGDAG